MVTNEEISKMLDAKRRGINIKKVKTSTINYKICPSCKSKNPKAAIFCVQCGKKLDLKSTVTCSSCGAENSKNAKFCVECGETLNKIPDASNEIKNSETEETKDTSEKEAPSSEPEEELYLNTKIDENEIENPDEYISNDNSGDMDKPLIKPIPSIKIPSSVPEHQIINQQNSKKLCNSCQSKNLKNAKFCVVCGEKFVDTTHDKKEEKIEPKTELGSNIESYEESMDKSESTDPIEKIKKAKELLDIGAITEEEFESIKTKYLQMI
jgi:ribosomal protein L40E